MRFACVALAATWVLIAQEADKTPKNPEAGKPESIAVGGRRFREGCAGCHGANAEGGRGPRLVDNADLQSWPDEQLFNTIRNGIRGTAMPSSPMPDKLTWQVVAFVRNLSAPALLAPLVGDPNAGRAAYESAGCAQCHMIHGAGGYLGPDLTNIGAGRTLAEIRTAITQPEKRRTPEYTGVTATLNDGRAISGIAKNRSNYSVQILDKDGRLHLLDRRDVKSLAFTEQDANLADAHNAARKDLDNIVAYLSRQAARSAATENDAATAPVGYADILKSPSENWLTYHGDYRGQRFSPLTQINPSNVKNLVPQWTYHVERANRLETTPVVFDGVMYVTNANQVDALDAKSGRRIWTYYDELAKMENVNRGVAILGNSVYFVTSDCHLVALNRGNGAVLWHKQFADPKKGYFASLAPLALRDRIVVGVSGGDSGMRGFVAAYSAAEGKELWRFYTVPLKGEPGSETWGEFDTQWGGGATWMTGTFDPELNLLFWSTGNPWPDYYGGGRRGANLYADSIVALDAGSGKLKWYFQFTPHDTHDWDAQSIPVLVDLPYKGTARKLLLHPNRNGFFYVLDRETGAFLSAKPFIEKLDWASGIDASGRPIEKPDMDPTPAGRRVCPSTRGASNWMSPSFSPQTQLLYVPTLEQCDSYVGMQHNPEPMRGLEGGGAESIANEPGRFYMRALDPLTGAKRWEYAMTGSATMWAGTVATAGGLVFFGDDDGQIVAVDARSGQDLWHYSMGQMLTASPITFAVDGKQYVSIAAATDVFTFALFDAGMRR